MVGKESLEVNWNKLIIFKLISLEKMFVLTRPLTFNNNESSNLNIINQTVSNFCIPTYQYMRHLDLAKKFICIPEPKQ